LASAGWALLLIVCFNLAQGVVNALALCAASVQLLAL
jgi:hypothetical protein